MSSSKHFLAGNAGTLALVSMLALSLALNVYFLKFGEPPWAAAPVQPLKVDAQLPAALQLVTAEGKPVTISFASDTRPTVLYVLSPLCEWCRRNEKDMRELVGATRHSFRYVGLSSVPNGLKQYIAKGEAPFPVYYVKSQALRRKLGIMGTPETIVVSPKGRVVRVWEGAYLKSNLKKVDAFFGVKLTGVQAVAAAGH